MRLVYRADKASSFRQGKPDRKDGTICAYLCTVKYNEAFAGMKHLRTPAEPQKVFSCFHLYAIQIDFNALGKSRSQVMQELRDQGIGSQVHYIPVPTQPFYKNTFGYKDGDYPVAEKYYEQELSLPLYPGLSDEDVESVIRSVKKIIK